MAPRSRLSIAKDDIVKLFKKEKIRIYRKSDIDRILNENRQFWRLTASTTSGKFLAFLLESTDLGEERIEFPYRPVVRYTWGDVDSLALVQSINSAGYFSHYTAMHLHGLTEQLPKSIYFNQEQRATGGGGTLSQHGINNAFRGKCRVTTNVATFRGHQVHLLNGQNTGGYAVIDQLVGNDVPIRVTTMERTLIDCVVRSVYAGGIFEVAKAFVRAHGKVSVNKLVATLKHLNFTYPYHQAIGFYLERTGLYKSNQLDLIRSLPIEYDFYLDYGMKNPAYSKEWKLFIPQGF